MSYHKCDDCGERFGRTEIVFDDWGGPNVCFDCDNEMRDQGVSELHAEYAPRAAGVVYSDAGLTVYSEEYQRVVFA